MKKIFAILSGIVLSMAMAVSVIPTGSALAKVSVKEKKLEATLYKKNGNIESKKDKITIKGTAVKKKKDVKVKRTVAVKSSDTAVVKVDKKGNVTYVGNGSAKITITETIKTTTKNKEGKKVTKSTKSTAIVPVLVEVVDITEALKLTCSCGCPECKAGECNIFDGCVCENEDCETCIFADYEGGKLDTDDEEDDDGYEDEEEYEDEE